MKDKYDCMQNSDYLKGETINWAEVTQIKEELVPYLAAKRQGEYMIEDYFALPDEHRVEQTYLL